MSELLKKLADCHRILYIEHHDDMNLGHVSARVPGSQTFWIKRRGPGFEEVCPEDLIEVDWAGRKVNGKGNPPGEYPVHSEIYRARPDVNCVLHTHPLWTVVFGIVGATFQMVNQDAVVFYRGLPVFSGTAELITQPEQGAQLARDLGDGNAILMRNHGVTIAAPGMEQALVWALNLEKALQAQLLALGHGGVQHAIDAAMAQNIAVARLSSSARFDDLFAYYTRKANRILGN